jgi:hypothetical protein
MGHALVTKGIIRRLCGSECSCLLNDSPVDFPVSLSDLGYRYDAGSNRPYDRIGRPIAPVLGGGPGPGIMAKTNQKDLRHGVSDEIFRSYMSDLLLFSADYGAYFACTWAGHTP